MLANPGTNPGPIPDQNRATPELEPWNLKPYWATPVLGCRLVSFRTTKIATSGTSGASGQNIQDDPDDQDYQLDASSCPPSFLPEQDDQVDEDDASSCPPLLASTPRAR